MVSQISLNPSLLSSDVLSAPCRVRIPLVRMMNYKAMAHNKAQKKNQVAAQRKQMKQLMRKKREEEEVSGCSDSEDDLIPKALLRQQKHETRRLIAEIEALRKKLEVERELCIQLQKALLKKYFPITDASDGIDAPGVGNAPENNLVCDPASTQGSVGGQLSDGMQRNENAASSRCLDGSAGSDVGVCAQRAPPFPWLNDFQAAVAPALCTTENTIAEGTSKQVYSPAGTQGSIGNQLSDGRLHNQNDSPNPFLDGLAGSDVGVYARCAPLSPCSYGLQATVGSDSSTARDTIAKDARSQQQVLPLLSQPPLPPQSQVAPPCRGITSDINTQNGPLSGATCIMAVPARQQESTKRGVIELPHIAMATVGDKVVLEEGVSVSKDKFSCVMGTVGDSRFCREMARLLWTHEELQQRSVTGSACGRFLKQGTTARKTLSPVKMRAMAGAFQEYIRRNCRQDQTPEGRLGKLHKFVRNLLPDISRK